MTAKIAATTAAIADTPALMAAQALRPLCWTKAVETLEAHFCTHESGPTLGSGYGDGQAPRIGTTRSTARKSKLMAANNKTPLHRI
jgi:hypothetical protein